MTRPAGTAQAGWNDSQPHQAPTVDELIKDAHSALDAAGVNISPSAVSRRVRSRVQRHGIDSATNMIQAYVGMTRERGSFEAFCLTYADPTGEIAVSNVMRRAGGLL